MECTILDDTAGAAPSPPLASALVAPFRYFYSPAKAAQRVAESPRFCSWLLLIFGSWMWAATIVFLTMWERTVVRSWESYIGPGTARLNVTNYTLAEVWQQWHPDGGARTAFFLVFSLSSAFILLVAIGTWLMLPTVHGGGPAKRSLRRSFAITVSGTGAFWLLTALIGSILIATLNHNAIRDVYRFDLEAVLTLLVAVGCCAHVVWVCRAARAVAFPPEPVELPPHCEGCGYNLTAQPMEGRCPECGEYVAASLSPDRRPGVAWQQAEGFTAGIHSAATVVTSPRQFYGSLWLRVPPEIAVRFARPQFTLLAALGAVWLFMMMLAYSSVGYPELPTVPLIGGLLIGLLAWILHRLIGATIMSWWIVKESLPCIDWARSIISYETTFLWVFALFNGFLISTFISHDMWITELARDLGFLRYGYMPIEILLLFAGNVFLIIYWLVRYRTAAEAVRWSNY